MRRPRDAELPQILEAYVNGAITSVQCCVEIDSQARDCRNIDNAPGTHGIVLYTGLEVIPFANNLYGVPLQALWQPIG
jgi:hypothetical protein